MPHCPQCSSLFTSLDFLYIHLKESHDLKKVKIFRCKESQCCRSYSTWESFRKHLITFHEFKSNSHKYVPKRGSDPVGLIKKSEQSPVENLKTQTRSLPGPSVRFDGNNSTIPTADPPIGEVGNADHELTVPDSNAQIRVDVLNDFLRGFEKQLDDIISKQTLELYADPHVTQVEVQRMMIRTKDLLNMVGESFKSMMKLMNQNITIDKMVESAIQKYFSAISNIVQKHDTHYKRSINMKRNGLYEPTPIIIGSSTEDKCKNNQVVKELTSMKIYYVSLKDTFRTFFERPGVLKSILKYMKDLYSNTTVLSNWIQGEYWRDKMRRFFIDKIVIPILLYIDDFEVNNPLGSHKGIQKICAIYCSILALPPEFRSKLENILLVMLFHASDRKNFGYSRILSHLVEELNDLSRDGIKISVDGVEITVYFVLAVVIGDNLGLNSILGLVECFRAFFFCRMCKVLNKFTQTDLRERKEALRVPENYLKDLEEGLSESGLKEYCKLNDVDYYHSYENWYFDILHDISEGDLKFALVEILFYFICEKKTLDLDILNDRIRTFNYTGNGFSNKPPTFLWDDIKNKKFSLSASETLTLFLTLPFLIGDIIDLEDEVWQFYLVLREILDLIQARDLQIECTYLIEDLVETHHEMFIRLFRTLRPKQHNMVHYGPTIRKGGPMISTIRFEGNHKFFKSAANSTSSRKEITYTLSLKDQFNFLYNMKYGKGLGSSVEVGPMTPVPTYLIASQSSLNASSSQCTWVKVKGIQYNVGTCVAVNLDDRDIPVFGIINNIFTSKENLISLSCKLLVTEFFDLNLHAFQVIWVGEFLFIENIDNLLSPFPMMIHRMPDTCLYVSPKHGL